MKQGYAGKNETRIFRIYRISYPAHPVGSVADRSVLVLG